MLQQENLLSIFFKYYYIILLNKVNESINYCLSHNNFKNKTVQYIGRKASASPAVGYLKLHNKEQMEIINNALSPVYKT